MGDGIFYSNNYIEYEMEFVEFKFVFVPNNINATPSIEECFNKFKLHLKDITNDLKKFDTCKN